MASKVKSIQVSLASVRVISVDIESYQTIAEKSGQISTFGLPGHVENGKKDQKSGTLVIMCMQACHMDPVEVMVSVQSRTRSMQVMRIMQSWVMPVILKRAQSRQLRSSGWL
jgi:hypothetical protein